MSETENKIKNEIETLLDSSQADGLKSANPFLAEQLASISPEQISIGECAEFIKGHFEGNLRTDGHKWAGDIKYTRTLNFDFTTREITFVSDKNRADSGTVENTAKKLYGLQHYAQAEAIYTKTELVGKEYFEIKDEMRALKRNLRGLCVAEHQKLGFYFESLNVLEYEWIPHEVVNPRLCPVYVLLKDKKERPYKTFIGWYSKTDGKPQINLQFLSNDPIYNKTKIVTAKEKRKKALIGTALAFAALATIGGMAAYLILSTI